MALSTSLRLFPTTRLTSLSNLKTKATLSSFHVIHRSVAVSRQSKRYLSSADTFVLSANDHDRVRMEFGSGRSATFLNAWLRDHCVCAECLNNATYQRDFDSMMMYDSKEQGNWKLHVEYHGHKLLNIDLDSYHVAIDLKTPADAVPHKCGFPVDWLEAMSHSQLNHTFHDVYNKKRVKSNPSQVFWDLETLESLTFPRQGYNEFYESPSQVFYYVILSQ